MRVYLASDHAGFELKKALIPYIGSLGGAGNGAEGNGEGEGTYEVVDVGPETLDPEDDYPELIAPCAEKVAAEAEGRAGESAAAFGIIIGSSGQGEAMVANRQKGVRAAVFYGRAPQARALEAEGTPGTDPFDVVRVAREHNDANILSLGARFISEDDAKEAVRVFLQTPFSNAARHTRRIAEF
ncbi:MAG: RpiB/LacA/LacB family sugar-phosphate isomerase [Candidatus Pacebacteria bacterium]|nr:RpiB/LacA/LacB family sugar-phosphate isomerase [Candidatus Paceibacterota bacterium]